MAQRLAQHLMARGLVPAKLVDEALRRVESSKVGLDTALLELTAISESGVLQAISDVSGIRLVNLSDFEPNAEAGPLMPFKMSKQLGVVPLSIDGQTLHVACAYPVPTVQLKDVGFLLGRKLELWVAVEARVRDWQSVIYGQPLDPAYQRVLRQLDPNRAPENPTESLSAEVVERSLDGITEEPLLLTAPRKKKKTIEVVDEPSVIVASEAVALGDEDSHTTVLDPTAYSRFARGGEAPAVPLDESESTRVLDTRGYANFAKLSTAEAAMNNNAMVFPGGVLPPRTSAPPPPPPTMAPVREWVQPASAPRTAKAPAEVKRASTQPPVEKQVRSAEPEARPTPPEPTPLGATVSTGLDETDFSDVNEVISPPPTAAPVVPPEPPPALPVVASPVPSSPRPATVVPLTEPFSTVPTEPTPQALPVVAAQESWTVPPPGASPWPQSSATLAASEVVYPAPPGLAPSSAMEWTLAQARQSLQGASNDRETLIHVVLEYGRRAFDFVAAFAVMRGSAVGWDVRGDGDPEVVRQLAIPLDAASVFRTVALTRGSYVGPLPPDALSQHYLALLGRAPRTVFVWPVEVQSRLVAMLYGDCGSKPVSQRRLADFILFCQELPTAFHELILFRKQNPKAPAFAVPTPLPSAEAAPPPSDVPADAEWFAGLITLLTGPDPSERSMAMLELMKTPEASAAALAHAFPGPTGWSRLPVVELPESDELGPIPGALTRLGHAAAVSLCPLLDSSDSDTRYLALLTAGSLRFPEVIDGVMRGLFDLEPDISSAARAAATSLRSLPTFQGRLFELHRELGSTDPLRRSLAARALGVLHDREAIDGLINLTGSDDELVANAAADALKEITRANLGTQPSAWTAWYARARSQRRIEWLVEALASDDFDLRLSAIEELSRTFGDNYGFFADGPQAERLQALEQWQNIIGSRPDLDV